MPFDSTTFAPAKADPLDLDAMIAWLETMPAEGEYLYGLCGGCAIAQFLKAMGYPDPVVGGTWFELVRGSGAETLPAGWNNAVLRSPRTYAAALSRFRALREAGQ